MTTPTWTAPVRYCETDQQGIVFNSHYLTYCDEAMAAFCLSRHLTELVENVRLKTSTLTWTSGATWGDTVTVLAGCTGVGRTSLTMHFVVSVGERECCTVETVYVNADADGVPTAISGAERQSLLP